MLSLAGSLSFHFLFCVCTRSLKHLQHLVTSGGETKAQRHTKKARPRRKLILDNLISDVHTFGVENVRVESYTLSILFDPMSSRPLGLYVLTTAATQFSSDISKRSMMNTYRKSSLR
jgi:hypothetical protein